MGLKLYELGLIIEREGDIPSMLILEDDGDKAVEAAQRLSGQRVDLTNMERYNLSSEEAGKVASCYDTTVGDILVRRAMKRVKKGANS